jgi:ferritin-like metal-binding protein YciE
MALVGHQPRGGELTDLVRASFLFAIEERRISVAKELKQLDDLFEDVLKDIYYAEKKILTALLKMAKAVQSPDLKAAFEKHHRETEGQVGRLEKVFGLLDQTPKGKKCEAIEGLVKEGQEGIKEFKGSPALDAALLATAQAVEHYEISRYGTLIAWANRLDMPQAAKLLQQTLDEEKKTDEALTELAEKAINTQAQEAA